MYKSITNNLKVNLKISNKREIVETLKILVIIILVSIISSCGNVETPIAEQNMPKEMPEDFNVRFMYGVKLNQVVPIVGRDVYRIKQQKSFNIRSRYGYGIEESGNLNGIDTYKGKLYKDLVMDGSASADIQLSKDQLKRIYDELAAVNIISYPSEYKPPYKDNPDPGVKAHVTPSNVYYVELSYGNIEYNLYWHNENGSKAAKAVELEKHLYNIIKIVYRLDEFKALPEPNGGYD